MKSLRQEYAEKETKMARLTKKWERLCDERKQQEEEFDQLQRKLSRAEDEKTKQHNEVTRMHREMRKHEEINEKITEKAKTAICQRERQLKKVNETCDRYKNLYEETRSMNANLQKELQSCQNLNDLLKTQIKSLESAEEMKQQANSKKPTITLVMDSNRRVVQPEIVHRLQKKYNIVNEETCYNTHQLKEYFENNDETKSNTTFVMIGTNDVKHCEDGDAIANLIAMRNMEPEKTYFIHVPPQSEKHRERKLLNEIYDKYYKTVPVPDMEKEPWTYLQDDGYHLRGEGGIRIADQIEETMRKLEETQNPSVQTNDEAHGEARGEAEKHNDAIQVPKHLMSQILGAHGDRINEINNRNRTSTRNIQQGKESTTIGIYGGKKDDVQRTKHDIEEIASKLTQYEGIRNRSKNIICKVYARSGHCNYGNGCWYSHNTQNEETPKSIIKRRRRQVRIESPHREQRGTSTHRETRRGNSTHRETQRGNSTHRETQRGNPTNSESYGRYQGPSRGNNSETYDRYQSPPRGNRNDYRLNQGHLPQTIRQRENYTSGSQHHN